VLREHLNIALENKECLEALLLELKEVVKSKWGKCRRRFQETLSSLGIESSLGKRGQYEGHMCDRILRSSDAVCEGAFGEFQATFPNGTSYKISNPLMKGKWKEFLSILARIRQISKPALPLCSHLAAELNDLCRRYAVHRSKVGDYLTYAIISI